MTTFAADHDTSRQLEQLDERTRTAWQAYRESTSTLANPRALVTSAAAIVSPEKLMTWSKFD